MKAKTVYLAFCVLGVAIPYAAFLPWLFESGASPALFVRELFANRISTFFALDLIVSAIVLIRFMHLENSRLRLSNTWLPLAATLCVGVSLGLPLFLYLREVALEQLAGKELAKPAS